jgi:hypothetical protein
MSIFDQLETVQDIIAYVSSFEMNKFEKVLFASQLIHQLKEYERNNY